MFISMITILSFSLFMHCSTSNLVPIQADKWDQIRLADRIHVYLKGNESKVMSGCEYQNGVLSGVWLTPDSMNRMEIRIPADSIEFMMGEEKLANYIVPLKSVDAREIDREEMIYAVLNDGELYEIWDPHFVSPNILEGDRYLRGKAQYGGVHLDSIRTVAVKGILDPWGDGISYREIRDNYVTWNRYMGLLLGIGAIVPSYAAGMYLSEGDTELTGAFTFWMWVPLAYLSFKKGTDSGLKIDRNLALEKILRERANAREDSCSQRE